MAGVKLSTVTLPEGFSWMDDSIIVGSLDNSKYLAKFTPSDTTNYSIVNNIEIPIRVTGKLKNISIKYNPNTGTGNMSDLEVNANKKVNLSKNTFTKKGYIFNGWSTDSNGSSTYSDEQEVSFDNDVVLYAVWEPINYTIKYNSNGGVGEIEQQSTKYDEKVKLKKNTFTLDKYVFKEWNTKSDGTGTSYNEESEVSNLTENENDVVTLYAIWKSIKDELNLSVNIDNWTYGDKEKEPSITYNCTNCTKKIEYKSESSEYSTEVPKQVGNYSLRVTVFDKDKNVIDSVVKNFAINKRVLTTPSNNRKYVFDGSEQNIVLNNYDSELMTSSISKIKYAGFYNVIINLKDSNNYIFDNNSDTVNIAISVVSGQSIVNAIRKNISIVQGSSINLADLVNVNFSEYKDKLKYELIGESDSNITLNGSTLTVSKNAELEKIINIKISLNADLNNDGLLDIIEKQNGVLNIEITDDKPKYYLDGKLVTKIPTGRNIMVDEDKQNDTFGNKYYYMKVAIEDKKAKYVKGSHEKLTFKSNGLFEKFYGIKIDGEFVDKKYYTAVKGSTIVTLSNEFLEKLKNGNHTISFVYSDNTVQTDNITFNVAKNENSIVSAGKENGGKNPKTGDGIRIFAILIILSGFAFEMLYLVDYKRAKSK